MLVLKNISLFIIIGQKESIYKHREVSATQVATVAVTRLEYATSTGSKGSRNGKSEN